MDWTLSASIRLFMRRVSLRRLSTLGDLQAKLKITKLSKQAQQRTRKRLRNAHNTSPDRLLFLEGHRLVIDVLQANNQQPSEVYLTQRSVAAPLGRTLLQALLAVQQTDGSLDECTSNPKPVLHWVTEQFLGSLSDTSTNQGVCAIIPHSDQPFLQHSNRYTAFVFCDRISDPGNLGTILRTSYGMGVDGVMVAEGCNVWVSG